MLSTAQFIIENQELKNKIKLFEISTKLDYIKIEKLKEYILKLLSINN